MSTHRHWWTTPGWADRGSQLQAQLYVNRRPKELTARVLEELPDLADRKPKLEWVAPLETPRTGLVPPAEFLGGSLLS